MTKVRPHCQGGSNGGRITINVMAIAKNINHNDRQYIYCILYILKFRFESFFSSKQPLVCYSVCVYVCMCHLAGQCPWGVSNEEEVTADTTAKLLLPPQFYFVMIYFIKNDNLVFERHIVNNLCDTLANNEPFLLLNKKLSIL